jgi:RimJ/RimL family protein N-acetyltransferase
MEITLRKIKVDDSDFLYNLYISRNPQDILTPINSDEQEKFVLDFIESNEKHPYENWNIIEVENKSVGSVTLNKKNNELGFWLIPDFQGKGIGPKAVEKFMILCKKDYYSAILRSDNSSSKSLVKKLGFELTHYKYTKKI